jgi:hypothetical protein
LEKVKIIKHVMSSAAEQAKTGALFINGKEAIPLRQTLIELNLRFHMDLIPEEIKIAYKL